MRIKCPQCNHVFEALEHPEPVGYTTEVLKVDNTSTNPAALSLHLSTQPSSYQYQTENMQPPAASYQPGESPTALSFSDKITSYRTFTHVQKKGSNEILGAIKKYDGATWKQLEEDTRLSTATISKRLKEGKRLGIIREELKDGKKVYRV